MGLFSKISLGLKKTRSTITDAVGSLLKGFSSIDDELFEELEEVLIMCDIGMSTATKICDLLKIRVKEEHVKDPIVIKQYMAEIISNMLKGEHRLDLSTKPSVIQVIGVNGAGKTTS
ncbi:MAG: signal recognition particle receptor subunit alpha, partial [bacterium]|nr:signal recognition particle receptor subunit alpha [bacterium]